MEKKKPVRNALDHLFDDDPVEEETVEAEEADSAVPDPPEPEPTPVPEPEPVIPEVSEPGLDMFNLDAKDQDKDAFGAFNFDFQDGMDDFSWDLTRDRDPEADARTPDEAVEEFQSMEKLLRDMSVAKRSSLPTPGT